MKLSVVIASLNESDLQNTIYSIRDTAGSRPEIIVVDDSSNMPVLVVDDIGEDNTHVIHNPIRCGVGPSRTIGALHASGDYLLLVDGHMRFTENWYDKALIRLASRPKTIHCAQCVGLTTQQMDPMQSTQRYWGGTLNIYGQDRSGNGKMQVLEPIWGPKVDDDAEIPCVMGACYFITRDWFLYLNPLAHLRSWGEDETMLSLKCWLAGGDVRFFGDVQIGHKFLTNGERQRFSVPVGYTVYNKLFAIRTLLAPPLAKRLEELYKPTVPPRDRISAEMILRDNAASIALEYSRNHQVLFKHSFEWFVERFGLSLPSP